MTIPRLGFISTLASSAVLAACSGAASPDGSIGVLSPEADARRRHSPSPTPSPTLSPTAAPTSSPSASPGGLIWGVTFDNVSGASTSQLAPAATMLQALNAAIGGKSWSRFVIDQGSDSATSNYTAAYAALSPYTNVMWEICDSSYVKSTSLSQYSAITSNFLAKFPNSTFEVGNELNGEWLGGSSYNSAVGLANPVVAKAYASWKLVASAGKQSALTLYYEPSQTVTNGYDMVTWAQKNFASLPDMANGLNKVLISYYETDNANVRPTLAQWTMIFQGLRAVFPNAAFGFGELGIDNPATSSTLAKAQSIMSYYYSLKPSVSNWCGGGFWWYSAEDLVPYSKPLFTLLQSLV